MNNILKIENLNTSYGKNLVLKDINLEIKEGSIFGLIGPNGAGKSTLMKSILGLVKKDSGKITLYGKEINEKNQKETNKNLGSLIEAPSFYDHLTAYDNLDLICDMKNINKDKIDKTLRDVGLIKSKDKKVREFSLGMKQRMGIAIALIGNPKFLILDEPINGLDPIGIIEFRELIKKLNREKKITILISSHILSELHQLATYYGIIHKGKLIEEICLEELNERCKKHINLEVDDSSKASIILENNLKIKNFSVLPNNVIKIYDYLDRVKLISNELVSNGVGIERINTQGDGLEEYFTRLIGGNRNV